MGFIAVYHGFYCLFPASCREFNLIPCFMSWVLIMVFFLYCNSYPHLQRLLLGLQVSMYHHHCYNHYNHHHYYFHHIHHHIHLHHIHLHHHHYTIHHHYILFLLQIDVDLKIVVKHFTIVSQISISCQQHQHQISICQQQQQYHLHHYHHHCHHRLVNRLL